MIWECIKCKKIYIVGKHPQYYYTKADLKTSCGPFCDKCKYEAKKDFYIEREKYLKKQGRIPKKREVILTKNNQYKIGDKILTKKEENESMLTFQNKKNN